MRAAVGSTNGAKLRAAQLVLDRAYGVGVCEVVSVDVPSTVSAQPLSDDEAMRGAEARARGALCGCADAHFGIGMEGTLMQVPGRTDRWFECGWMCVVDRDGKLGFGSSARFELPADLATRVLAGEELGDVMASVTGDAQIRASLGAMGVLTNGLLPRDEAYAHGFVFALIPWLPRAGVLSTTTHT